MKFVFSVSLATVAGIICLLSCQSPQEKREQLAKTYCASCHAFPDPSLLDKKTWQTSVLPKMAFRMGLDYSQLMNVSEEDQPIVMRVLPEKPMISQDEWEAIKDYYISLAPDSLTQRDIPEEKPLEQFEISSFQLADNSVPMLSLLEADTANKVIYLGTRYSRLYKLDFNLNEKYQLQLPSPPSDIIITNDGPVVVTMGIMDPNDQSRGALNFIDEKKHTITPFIDSLKRPVAIEHVDLNNDGLNDYIICAFGNYTGQLLAYENLGNNKFRPHVMSYLPGARNVVVRDLNADGLPDVMALMTQGDEQIIRFINKGNFTFRHTSLLRFSPVYGSSYFELCDFNGDGKADILYTNGDNADDSPILKPYHGVRIFLNDGRDQFKESWFYPMHGASKAMAHDFDQDGDPDIAAFSFFPDFQRTPHRGFIYFENTANGFIPRVTPLGAAGRWLVMDIADLDNDNDMDILLGALNFSTLGKAAVEQSWSDEPSAVLILRNKLH